MKEVRKLYFIFYNYLNTLLIKFLLKFLDRNKQKITAHPFTKSHKTNENKENKENSSWIPNKIRGKRHTNISGKNKLNVKRRKEDDDIIDNALRER